MTCAGPGPRRLRGGSPPGRRGHRRGCRAAGCPATGRDAGRRGGPVSRRAAFPGTAGAGVAG
ncbi:hypothetical protein D3105_30495 [Streptomyces globisporus]|uniref:Uncharacterized protein n=1 Tax=Streptomyces globisporus TaxID=1908 RepID=A0A423URA5_STRGL|nr:hypothetical protein D3105_30495 [Streptomyces globisporus]